MKKLIFEELMILSMREKKGKKVKFNPTTTIIKGTNQVGKSSLIKSIYYTLGATPGLMHPNWLKTEPISLLKFTIDNERFSVLRFDKKRFVVITNTNQFMSFNFKSFSVFLNDLLDFKFIINNRNGEPETPPPAYLFLPFYVDQDKSWSKNWDSFANLSQFGNWKNPLINYHSGIKGNSYYTTKSELDRTRLKLDETSSEIDALNKILKNINKKLSEVDLNVTIEDFNEEIKELLHDCEILKTDQNKIKQQLTDLYNQKISIDSKLDIVKKSIQEVQKDYKFAVNKIENDVDCPTCGAHYENNFAERFSIAEDQESLQELYDELMSEYLKIKDEIDIYNKDFIDKKSNYEKIQEVLNRKKSNIKLVDIIENEGKKRVKEIFKEEQTLIYTQIIKSEREKNKLEEKLKEIDKDGKVRKDNIMTIYRSSLKKYLKELNINTEKVPEQIFQRMDSTIKETGSALPRALLAYYFTFFKIMDKYSTSTFCPVIIDSPNQQEQDKDNLKAIMNFIEKNKPNNTQLILGLVDDNEYTFDLNKKESLLQNEDYDEVYKEIRPILDAGIFNDELDMYF
ncbi:AAA family ATPase [uncultured Formosa sp.]|uniref:AAA family ATPase n=1 Tax=uncultured Formosa sp. TaxID=255435 RepID=UPI00261A91D6|nr:AAA family ATPase [uncultured Formosa sp.]